MFVKAIVLALWAWADSKFLITAQSERNAERASKP